METLILPIFMFVIGLASMFFDFQGSTGYKKWGISFLIVLILGSISYLEIVEKKDAQNQANSLSKKLDNSNQKLDNSNQKLDDANQTIDELEQKIIDLSDDTLLKVRQDEQRLRRQKIAVYYFERRKGVDSKDLYSKLKELEDKKYGFKSVEPLDCIPSDCLYETNAIWFGSKVTKNDIKIVANRLISGRVVIKVIRQFYDSNNREFDIEIGYDKKSARCEVWQADVIDNASKFPRGKQDIGCPNNASR